MPYECPECKKVPFEIISKIRLPADGYSDEISLFIFECTDCKFEVVGVIEESRHGDLSKDSWHITGYSIKNESIKKLKDSITKCPDPTRKSCNCHTHQQLGQQDDKWNWDGLRKSGYEILKLIKINFV